MPETPETADDIRTIRYRIESIETTQHLLLRVEAKELLAELLPLFETDENLERVYLALDQPRNQGQILEYLHELGVDMSQPTVSRKLTQLNDEGLIEKHGAGQGGVSWRKKEVVEKVLRLSRQIKKQRQGAK